MPNILNIKILDTVYDLKAKYDVSDNEIETTYAKIDAVPSKLSLLLNDSGFLTEHLDISHLATDDDLQFLEEIMNAGFSAIDERLTDLNDNLDIFSYGVEWDITVASPECTRIGNPLLHKSLPILSAYRGVLADGSKILKYLNPDDWRYKVGDDFGETRGVTFVGTNTFVALDPSEYCVGLWIKLRTGNSEGVVSSIVDSIVTINWTSSEIPEENSTHQLVLGELLDGSRGTVRVHIPRFYGKSGENGNKRWVRISTVLIDDSWLEIPEMLIDAYRSTVDLEGNKAVSVVNTSTLFRGGLNRSSYDIYTDPFRSDLGKPRTDINRATMRTYAANASSEMLCYEYYKWIFCWCYVIEYANFNSQATYNADLTSDGFYQGGLGPGVTEFNWGKWSGYNVNNPLTPCGYCNEFGNFTGVKDLVIPETVISETFTIPTITLKVPRWRGFDNPFGDIYTNLDGILIKRDLANEPSAVYSTSNPLKFGDTEEVIASMNFIGTEIPEDGYIKQFDLGIHGEIIPSVVRGNTATYKCDIHHCNTPSTSLRTLLVGGSADLGGDSGLFAFLSNNGVGDAFSLVGFRTLNTIY